MIEFKLLKKVFNVQLLFNLITNSTLSILLISYVLFSMFSILQNTENDYYFTDYNAMESGSIGEGESYKSNLNLIFDQDIIFENYVNWLFDFIQGEFGPTSYDDPNPLFKEIKLNVFSSLKLICLGLLVSFIISLFFLYLSSFPLAKKTIVDPFLSISLFHILFTAFFLFQVLVKIGLPFKLAVVLSISLGSGILFDYYTLIFNSYDTIINKDYAKFSKNSGFSILKFTFTELLINFFTITLSRIPILFGGLIILEVYKPELEGIGFLIWRSIQTVGDTPPALHTVYISSIIMISILFYIFAFNEHIRLSLSPKENK